MYKYIYHGIFSEKAVLIVKVTRNWKVNIFLYLCYMVVGFSVQCKLEYCFSKYIYKLLWLMKNNKCLCIWSFSVFGSDNFYCRVSEKRRALWQTKRLSHFVFRNYTSLESQSNFGSNECTWALFAAKIKKCLTFWFTKVSPFLDTL